MHTIRVIIVVIALFANSGAIAQSGSDESNNVIVAHAVVDAANTTFDDDTGFVRGREALLDNTVSEWAAYNQTAAKMLRNLFAADATLAPTLVKMFPGLALSIAQRLVFTEYKARQLAFGFASVAKQVSFEELVGSFLNFTKTAPEHGEGDLISTSTDEYKEFEDKYLAVMSTPLCAKQCTALELYEQTTDWTTPMAAVAFLTRRALDAGVDIAEGIKPIVDAWGDAFTAIANE